MFIDQLVHLRKNYFDRAFTLPIGNVRGRGTSSIKHIQFQFWHYDIRDLLWHEVFRAMYLPRRANIFVSTFTWHGLTWPHLWYRFHKTRFQSLSDWPRGSQASNYCRNCKMIMLLADVGSCQVSDDFEVSTYLCRHIALETLCLCTPLIKKH